MKILLFGDASNYHNTLSAGLRRIGHDVTVASDGTRWMDTPRDIDLKRADNPLGGALLWLRLLTTLAPKLRGYDVVQLASPHFIELKPVRVAPLYERLRRDNRSVFVSALATDSLYVQSCLSGHSPLRYSEFHIGNRHLPYASAPEGQVDGWLKPNMLAMCRDIYDRSDGIVSALQEYNMVVASHSPHRPLAYGGIPIDLQKLRFGPVAQGEKVRLLVAIHSRRMLEKGTDILLEVAQEIAREMPDRVELDVVRDLRYDDFLKRLAAADIVFDQLYSYTPATTALLAMAMGKVAVSGGEPDYYEFIGENELRPVVNANPADPGETKQAVVRLINDRAMLQALGRDSRTFVERHNAAEVVARRFEQLWLTARPDLMSVGQ